MRWNKKPSIKSDKTETTRTPKRGVVGYSRKSALLEEAITQMNAGKYGRSSAALKELLALDPVNMEARRLFATLHLRLGSLIPAREAFDTLITEAFQRQDYWLAESLLREYLAAGPRCVPYLEKLGMIYQEKGNVLEAVEEYGKAVDILIEDPDPERPGQAVRLYAKIRELAPASPVAFRLASFFDAETGEFVMGQPSTLETAAAVQPDVVDGEARREQTALSGADGAMPWEVQVLSEVVEPSAETALPPEVLPSAQEKHPADSLQSVEPSELELVRSGEDVADQAESAESIGIEAQFDGSVEISTPESRGEVQVLSEVVELSAETALPPEVVLQAPAKHRADSPQPVESSEQEMVCLVEGAADQAEPIDIEAPIHLPAKTSVQGAGAVSPAAELSRLAEQELAGAAHPFQGSEDSGAEIAVTPSDAHLDEATAEFALFQAPEPVSADVPGSAPLCEDRPTSGSMRSAAEQTADSSACTSETVAVPDLSCPTQPDREPPVVSLRTVPVDVESIPVSIKEEVLLQTDKVERLEENDSSILTPRIERAHLESIPVPNTEQAPLQTDKAERLQGEEIASSTGLPRAPEPVSDDGTSQPWKQPGFSWKSVFDTAWKFGEPSPEKDAATSSASTHPEETIADTLPLPSPQDRPAGDSDGERLKQEEAETPADGETSRSPIASMPWDQVQESMISIPSVETNASTAEPLSPPVDQLQGPDSTPQACDSQSQPAPSIKSSDPEPVSFSFAKNVASVCSEERPHPDMETGALSTMVQGIEQAVESAPAFSFVRSSQRDEEVAAASSEPEPQSCTHDPSPGPSVDQEGGRGEPLAFAIKREQCHSGETIEEVKEVVSENIVRARHSEPAPTERSMDDGAVTPKRQASSPPLLHESGLPEMVHVQAQSPIPEPMPSHQEQMGPDVSAQASRDPSVSLGRPGSIEQQEVSQPLPAVHMADAAFIESSRSRRESETRARIQEPAPRQKSAVSLNGVGIAVIGFLHSCFSTTQAIVRTVVWLAMLLGLCIVLGLGALALTWMTMEEPPSATFQSFTTTPQQSLSGPQKNAYTLLMGIDAPVGQDPLRAGYEKKPDFGKSAAALSCSGNSGPEAGDRSGASASTMRGWVRGADPIGQFKAQQGTIQGWGSRDQVTLERYRQWQKLQFEDWGYGQSASPPCEAMVFAHQLYLADGFVQGTDVAVDRLETDMGMWRVVLSQARTLPVKMLALQAINDDIALASGMLVRSDFDTKHLGRITKFVRPLDQGELSLRWPMQSELVSAGRTYESQLKAARADGQALSGIVASALPLPKQRRLNDYARYYETSYQATGEKHYTSLPKWKDFIRFPAVGVMDYLANPIENLVGVDPLPAWDLYNGMMVDTDAHLRLASLQAWLRRGPSEGDLPNKIAKAGQNFYDPYTGLPMLVNQKKGVLYSVGHDGKDQDADPQTDVVVEIPGAVSSSKSR